jgi:FixJ family two-component response regulator
MGLSDSLSAQVGQSGGAAPRPFEPGDYTVFVVDDDPRLCAELTALLERAGYHARAFHSAEAALEALAAHPDNVGVIAEIELPGMSGLDLISRFREQHLTAPIMILTGLGDVATAVRAMRERVSDYLVKPYVERDLINRLRNALLKQYAASH